MTNRPVRIRSMLLAVLTGLLLVIVMALPRPKVGTATTRVFHFGAEAHAVEVSETHIGVGLGAGVKAETILQQMSTDLACVDERLPERAMAVFAVRSRAFERALAALRSRADVRFAHPVHHLGSPRLLASRYLLTDEFVVRFAEGERDRGRAESAVAAVGARLVEGFAWLDGAYLCRTDPGVDALVAAETLAAEDDVLFAHPNWVRKLTARESIPNDPLFGNQWHLKNIGQGGGTLGADIKATLAWDLGTGAGRTIAVIDTGVDSGLSDISQTANGYNPYTGAGPTAGDDIATHGTCCAGVAGGTGNNGILLSGVARGAVIMPIQLLTGSGYGTATDEVNCFNYAVNNGADVITCSWGPDGVPFPLPTLVQASFIYATTSGRGGLGTPIFWASGNGNEDVATDGYVSSIYTIAVGATTNFDVRASYSDYGAALDLVAPSSGGSRAINTTVPGNTYTSNFGGTSAAAPQGAGAAAILMEINPALTWMDVRDILRRTADKVQTGTAAYNSSGHSINYGYGRLNVFAAALEAWSMAGPGFNLLTWSGQPGGITIVMTGMAPGAEFLLGVSAQVYTPIGQGPLMGLGYDAWSTLTAPLGQIPVHGIASPAGTFWWGTTGVPAGLTLQLRAFQIVPGVGFGRSNVVQISF